VSQASRSNRCCASGFLVPLGLRRTFLEPAEQPTAPVARHPARDVWKPLPAIVTTAEELARFGHALFNGTLINAQSLRAMLDFEATSDIPCAEECHMRFRTASVCVAVSGRCVSARCGATTDRPVPMWRSYPRDTKPSRVVTNVEPWPDGFGLSIMPAVTRDTCP
jgi:CubicO group peptidase (beta-lactamase class C family)